MSDLNDMEAVYKRYALPLKKYIMTLCHDDFLADDLVADTFYKAITHADSWRGGNIYTWLCTIGKNLFLNHVKRKEYQNLSLDDEENPFEIPVFEDPNVAIEREEQKTYLQKKLQELSDVDRKVVYLRTYADLSFKEIGDVLGKTENWARVTFFRSKEKLRRSMERME
ncbi:MAG: RNA polymerase sigma factor [Clostridiales bacterium]|nr:RNA polymerase sigma factor [Clostridiales bacterium]